jgi:type IV secretory pathway protease TraF
LTPLTIARLRPSPVRSRIKSRSKSVTESTSPGYIWNASESVPIGLYRLQPIERLTVTDLVAIRPPSPLAHFLDLNGYLPLGVRMLKRVLALPGLTVCRTGPTIAVDNVEVGQARERDGRGRLLPVWQGAASWRQTQSLSRTGTRKSRSMGDISGSFPHPSSSGKRYH